MPRLLRSLTVGFMSRFSTIKTLIHRFSSTFYSLLVSFLALIAVHANSASKIHITIHLYTLLSLNTYDFNGLAHSVSSRQHQNCQTQ